MAKAKITFQSPEYHKDLQKRPTCTAFFLVYMYLFLNLRPVLKFLPVLITIQWLC